MSVEYGVKILDESVTFKNNSGLISMMDEVIANSGSLSFVLVIQNNVSKFYDNSGLSNVGNNSSSALILSGYSGVVYNFNGNIYQESRSLPKNTLVKELYKSNWVLVNETKLIGNYLCYKAVFKYKYIDKNNKTKTITAWFAPSLPFSYGPIEFNGLPGLILELNKDYTTFSAQKIVLLKEEIEVDFPKGKRISQDEYEKKLMQNFRY